MTNIVPNWAVTDVEQSGNFNEGRSRALDAIVCHHWGVDGQQHQDVVNFLCNANRPNRTSAHYVASAGRVTQIVSDLDTAWHCPNWNARGIGIECHPEMTDGDFETVATLIAAIRSEHGHLPLSGHQDHYPTACPGRWESQLGQLSARADEILAAHNAGRPVSVKTAASTTATVSAANAPVAAETSIDVDGWWGQGTTRRLQQVLGTPDDSVVSSQAASRKGILAACTSGWEFVPDAQARGSQVITAMQRRLGTDADGIVGPGTVKALEAHYGFSQDGHLDGPSNTVNAMQKALNAGGF